MKLNNFLQYKINRYYYKYIVLNELVPKKPQISNTDYINIFGHNYNVLRIMSGMGNLSYSN